MPEKTSVTDKRISSKVREVEDRICKLYDQYFPRAKAGDEFWPEVFALDDVLAKALERRPLGIMQIKNACKAYSRDFLELCVAGRARDQRKASGATDQKGEQGAV